MADKILAIDPATQCGWALKDNSMIMSGTWNLKNTRCEGAGMRFVKMRNMLESIGVVDMIVFEEVRRHKGTAAAHIYGGLAAVIMSWGEDNNIPYTAIPVGTIKKHATGKGNANKKMMMAAAAARWPEQNVTDDNQADALWILDAAVKGVF